jgi:type IV secretion system protein VirB10
MVDEKNTVRKPQEFAIKTKPKSMVRINRILTLSIAITIIVLFIWIIIATLHSPAPKSKTETLNDNIKQTAENAGVNNSILKQLPKNYADTNTIKKYMPATPIETQNAAIPTEVKQELISLKNQQALLQQQLNNLVQINERQKQARQEENSRRILQAQASNLFFSNVAPPPATPIDQKGKSDNDKEMQSALNQQDSMLLSKQDAYNQQNMQLQKLAFLQPSKKDEDIYNKHPTLKPISPYELQAGTLIPAELITAINTTLPGSVVAQVRTNVFDTVSGKYLLIPQGSKLIGAYQSMVSYGQERVLIAFTRIIRPDGSSMQLDKYSGADIYGQSGMKGHVDNHWGRVLGAATLSTLLSVGAGVAADRNYYRKDIYYPSSGQNALLGAASSVSQTGQQLTDRAMNIQPTLTIPPGYEFNIIVRKDVVMEPFKGNKDV